MHWKRTTGPGGPEPPDRPARPVKQEVTPERRITPARVSRIALELARERRRLAHRPSVAQLRTMARLNGRAPCSYRLDAAVNWLPESLPVGFPLGADGLCFAHAGGEVVVLPDGAGFALA